jgi:hypothetical protein
MARKHIFDAHFVLQFYFHNTLPDQNMNDVSIQLTPSDDNDGLSFMEEFTIPASRILAKQAGQVCVAFALISGR